MMGLCMDCCCRTPLRPTTHYEAIDDILDAYKVVMFTKSTCPSCEEAKKILDETGVQFAIMDLNLSPIAEQIARELISRTGEDCVPQIFVDGIFIGGTCELKTLKCTRDLYPLLGVPAPKKRLGGINIKVIGPELVDESESSENCAICDDDQTKNQKTKIDQSDNQPNNSV